MGNLTGRMPTKGKEITEHDDETGKSRVIGRVDGNTVSYEDTNFTSADTLSVLDVQSDLGRRGYKGYFINDGPGDIKLEVSNDGTAYGGVHSLRGGETMAMDDLNIAKIRLTYVDPTEYRCLITG